METYAQKLRDPRWQKRRLEVLERDGWRCTDCGDPDSELHVHHVRYKTGANPWDYEDSDLRALCASCHRSVTQITRDAKSVLYDMLNEDPGTTFDLLEAISGLLLLADPDAVEWLRLAMEEISSGVVNGRLRGESSVEAAKAAAVTIARYAKRGDN